MLILLKLCILKDFNKDLAVKMLLLMKNLIIIALNLKKIKIILVLILKNY